MIRVWIDQDCCTGAGLCVDRCPDLFIVMEDGIGYLRIDGVAITDPPNVTIDVPSRLEQWAIDAADHCPGECIYVEPAPAAVPTADDDIVDAEVVEPPRTTPSG